MPHRSKLPIADRNTACRRRARWAWLGLVLATLTGCSSLSLPKDFAWPWDDDHVKAPARMTDMWSFTVLQQVGRAGVRGYGGRLMFYDADDKPMKIDGTLTVYAFDARSSNPSQAIPERKFVFLPKDLPKHYSESKLGHSYSFWLPWDEVGGPERQIALVTRFECKGGQAIMSSPSRQILPGNRPEAGKEPPPVATAPANVAGDVRQVSHQEPLPNGGPNRTGTSVTIDLPPSFVRQALVAGPAVDDGMAANKVAPATVAPPPSASAVPNGQLTAQTGQGAKPPSNTPDPARQTEPAARSAPPRFPARREATVVPGTDPVRRQPFPGQWPSALPPTPRWDRWREAADNPPAAAGEAPAASPPAAQNNRN
jgi:hypothetical protein